jgi:hypothetical protein
MDVPPYLRSLPQVSRKPGSTGRASSVIVIVHGKGKDFDAACQTLPLVPPPDAAHKSTYLARAPALLVASQARLPFPPLLSTRACLGVRLETPSHTNTSPTPLRPVLLSPQSHSPITTADTLARAPSLPPCSGCPSIASHPRSGTTRARLLATNHLRAPRLHSRR